MIERVNVYYDGTAGPEEPGEIGSYAFLVFDNDELLHQESGPLLPPAGQGIANIVAEYLALLKALDWLVANKKAYNHVRFYGDSLMIVNQLNREYPFKVGGAMRWIWEAKNECEPLQRAAVTSAALFRDLQFSWVSKTQIAQVRDLAEAGLIAHGIEPARITKEKRKASLAGGE